MRRLLLVAIILAATGCSVLPARPPAPALHDFGPAGAATASGQGARISVSAPDWLMSEQIPYRLAFEDPTRVRYYNLDRWLAPPPAMLAQYLSAPANDLQVSVRLLQFEQVFDSPTSARVLMRFRASVAAPGDGREKRSTEFHLSRPCRTADAKGAVAAFAPLVAEAGTRLREWLDGPGPEPGR